MVELERVIDAYLEGELSHAETLELERNLKEPAVAARFLEQVWMREALAAWEVPAPSGDLTQRILGELERERHRDRLPAAADRLPGDEGSVVDAGWLRQTVGLIGVGPKLALQGSRIGFQSMRYALGPLAFRWR